MTIEEKNISMRMINELSGLKYFYNDTLDCCYKSASMGIDMSNVNMDNVVSRVICAMNSLGFYISLKDDKDVQNEL